MAERFADYLHRRGRAYLGGAASSPIRARHWRRHSGCPEQFKHWVKQDYLYLIDYARLFAIAVAKAPDLQTMTKFAEMVHAVLDVEMDLHRSYAREWGISAEELEKTLEGSNLSRLYRFPVAHRDVWGAFLSW